jgi:hypothetical protein
MNPEVLRSKEAFLDACDTMARRPAELTDADIAILGENNPRLRREAEQACAHARLARVQREQRASKVAQPAPSSPSSEDAWLAATPTYRALLKCFAGALTPVHERIKALEAQPHFADLIGEILRPVLERIAALEQQPRGLSWEGVWEDGVEYHRSGCVTHQGSLWLCVTTATRVRPGSDNSGWRLIVKKGSLDK